ncbi:MAG: hypothetical protein HF978_13430 [Desulfobacteraceae bacterium]|nr:respiratory nitrate reductase subunit gamma [Desulfobacteraceae bacterium]MBC2756544.1 hypothetical protein [Desulfobacteraceae bacterium]
MNKDIDISNWFKIFLNTVIKQQQIKEYGVLPWVMHLMIFYGFSSLFILTAFHSILTWGFSPSGSVVHFFKDGFGAILFAIWGDIGGLILLGGIIIALVRRYILKPDELHTISDDAVVIWLLFAVTVTGYGCEMVRLLARPESIDAGYSFVAYLLFPLIKWVHPGEIMVTLAFYFHGILSMALIAYIPFSKLKHMFTAPLNVAFVSSGSRYTKI